MNNSPPWRQCNLPIFYFLEDDIPKKYKVIIRQQFDYWNGVAYSYTNSKKKLFVLGGDISILDGLDLSKGIDGMTMIRVVPFTNNPKALAHTKLRRVNLGTGCIGSADIFIVKKALRLEDDTVEMTVRHEIGHILGLWHSERPGDLMYPDIDRVFNNIVLSDWEIEAFKEIYK